MKAAKMKSPKARWTRDGDKESYWRRQVGLWQESGLSVRAFCKEHGVIETSFYAWRRELIVRARESGSIEEISEAQYVPPNKLKDGRGRSVSIRFRQTDHHALESHIAQAENSNPFVPLTVVPDKAARPKNTAEEKLGVTLMTPRGYQVSIARPEDIDLLTQILNALEESK